MKTTTCALTAAGLACLLMVSGCTQDDVASFKTARAELAEGGSLADDLFQADITFCRRVGTKTGKRIEAGEEFQIRDGDKYDYVNALIDVANIPADVTHQVHLAWIRPDGRELFRRFGTVTFTTNDEGFLQEVVWMDAEDLHDVQIEDAETVLAPALTLSSRLNVRPDKERDPGIYAMRFYWNRELMLEKTFELLAAD